MSFWLIWKIAWSAAVDLGQYLQLSPAIIGFLLEEGSASCVCVED